MRIQSIETVAFEPQFEGSGYVMSFVRQTVLHDRLIRITFDNGAVGYGESVRYPTFAADEASAAEDEVLSDLKELDASDLPLVLSRWRSNGKILRGIAFAVETAWLDAIGKMTGMPISSLLGGPRDGDVPEYYSISSEAPDQMAELIKTTGGNYPVIQAKLGIDDIATDLERVRAVLKVMKPEQLLLADFNGALSVSEAQESLPAISDVRLMWEEPCESYEDNVELARTIKAPVMFDQCLDDLGTYARAIADRAAAALVIKPALIGGMDVARVARDMCAAANIRIRIDGPWCGQIGAAAALHLGIGAPPELLIAGCDLTQPMTTGRTMLRYPVPGRIGAASGSGLGPIPHEISSMSGFQE